MLKVVHILVNFKFNVPLYGWGHSQLFREGGRHSPMKTICHNSLKSPQVKEIVLRFEEMELSSYPLRVGRLDDYILTAVDM